MYDDPSFGLDEPNSNLEPCASSRNRGKISHHMAHSAPFGFGKRHTRGLRPQGRSPSDVIAPRWRCFVDHRLWTQARRKNGLGPFAARRHGIQSGARATYYRAEIILNDGQIDRLPAHITLIPGMPVEAFIRTSDRSPLSYLVKPLTDYFAKAFREG